MSTFCDRLKEERDRLGLTQENFAALGGVKKRAQVTYEKGERVPDVDYLGGLESAGVDVNYLLTGERVYDLDLKAMGRTERYATIYLRLKSLEEKLGVEFGEDGLITLGKYASEHCPTEQALEEFIRLSYDFIGQSIKDK